MPYLVGILTRTPPWVWALLALLILLGVQAARTREAHVLRFFITPAIFIAWGGLRLLSQSALTGSLALEWLGGAALGIAVGAASAQMAGMAVNRAARRVRLPGHWLPLARNLIIFAKYAIAVAVARQLAARETLLMWDFAISGAAAGYFIGWVARFIAAYRRAPEMETMKAPSV